VSEKRLRSTGPVQWFLTFLHQRTGTKHEVTDP